MIDICGDVIVAGFSLAVEDSKHSGVFATEMALLRFQGSWQKHAGLSLERCFADTIAGAHAYQLVVSRFHPRHAGCTCHDVKKDRKTEVSMSFVREHQPPVNDNPFT